jgi:hypothetical protein
MTATAPLRPADWMVRVNGELRRPRRLALQLVAQHPDTRILTRVSMSLPNVARSGHLPVGVRHGLGRFGKEGGRRLDPVMTATVITATITAAGTVLAGWVQGRAQRPATRNDS